LVPIRQSSASSIPYCCACCLIPDPDRLVSLWLTAPGFNLDHRKNVSPSEYFTFREEGRAFERIGLWVREAASVTGSGDPEEVVGLGVTEDTLPALAVQPILGRWFTHGDDSPGGPKTVMLSYEYWQRRFGASSAAIGKKIDCGRKGPAK
jgi:hypothetical protein